jgi:hypothetical protein
MTIGEAKRAAQLQHLSNLQADLKAKVQHLTKTLERAVDKGEEIGRPNMSTMTDIIYLEADIRAVHYELFGTGPAHFTESRS